MKVAIVGTGLIAGTHAQALGRIGQQLTMVVGSTEERARAFAENWGVAHASKHFDDALAADVDCLHICTPPHLHYAMVKQALLAGKHVVCEKPLTLRGSEAKELDSLAREKGLLSAVNFNVRFYEACSQARNLVASGQLGPLRLIHGSYLQEFHMLPAEYSWRYNDAVSGKMRAVTEIGSHWIDLVRFWTGLEVEAVSATLGRFLPVRMLEDGVMNLPGHNGKPLLVNSEDAAAVTLRLSEGVMGSMLLSEVSAGRVNSLSLEVDGDAGAVWWNSQNPGQLCRSMGKMKGESRLTHAFSGGFPDTFITFFEKVYMALQCGDLGEKNEFATFCDGWRNAAVCDAIWESDQNASAWTAVEG